MSAKFPRGGGGEQTHSQPSVYKISRQVLLLLAEIQNVIKFLFLVKITKTHAEDIIAIGEQVLGAFIQRRCILSA